MQRETPREIEQKTFLIEGAATRFARTGDGRLVMHGPRGQIEVSSLSPTFPLTNRGQFVVVRDADGEEIGILDNLRRLDPDSRQIVHAELERAYFMPVVTDIADVREDLGLVTWKLDTDHGPRTIDVRNVRRNLRRMGRRRVIMKDVDGNRYDIPDRARLPARARAYLDHYL